MQFSIKSWGFWNIAGAANENVTTAYTELWLQLLQ